MQVVETFQEISGRKIPFRFVGRRPGDSAECYADIAYSAQRLDWCASRDIKQMVEDHWRWQRMNPEGYKS